MSEEERTDLEHALAALAREQEAEQEPPSEDELVELARGQLDESRAEEVREYLAVNPKTARRVLDLKAAMRGEPPAGESQLSAGENQAAWKRLGTVPPVRALPRKSGGGRSRREGGSVAVSSWAWGLAASALLAMLVLAWVHLSSVEKIRQLQQEAGQRETRLLVERESAESLRQRLEQLQQMPAGGERIGPELVAENVYLEPVQNSRRNSLMGTPQELRVGPFPSLLRLNVRDAGVPALFDLEAWEQAPSGREERRWSLHGLEPLEGQLQIQLYQQLLPPGVYELRLFRHEPGERRSILDFRVKAVAAVVSPDRAQ